MKNKMPVVVIFTANTCHYCQSVIEQRKDIYDKLREVHPDIQCFLLDNQDMSGKYFPSKLASIIEHYPIVLYFDDPVWYRWINGEQNALEGVKVMRDGSGKYDADGISTWVSSQLKEQPSGMRGPPLGTPQPIRMHKPSVRSPQPIRMSYVFSDYKIKIEFDMDTWNFELLISYINLPTELKLSGNLLKLF